MVGPTTAARERTRGAWLRATLVIATCFAAMAWGAWLVFRCPLETGRFLGRPSSEVEAALGSPSSTWSASDFQCLKHYRCRPETIVGDVWFYSRSYWGCYLYLDERGFVARHECVVTD